VDLNIRLQWLHLLFYSCLPYWLTWAPLVSDVGERLLPRRVFSLETDWDSQDMNAPQMYAFSLMP